MKKIASLFLTMALCMGLAVPAFAAEYSAKTFTGNWGGNWHTDTPSTATIDKVSTQINEGVESYHIPVGATVTVDLGTEGPLYITGLTGNWMFDPASGTMVPTSSYFHWDYPTLKAGNTYSFTVTKEMADSFATAKKAAIYATDYSASLWAGSWNDFASELQIVRIIFDADESDQPATPAETATPFTDVKPDAYYADSVKWAVDNGITSGTTATTFSPNNTCTTAQILTFLWRANGSPAPAGSNAAVPAGKYYSDAANWALEKGLTDAFSADTPATRAATVTYLWKLAGKPAADAAAFTDVDEGAEYAQAVAWAVQEGITAGTTATTFSPDSTCTRGQIVTFLYRDLA